MEKEKKNGITIQSHIPSAKRKRRICGGKLMERYKAYLRWYNTEMEKPRSVVFMSAVTVAILAAGGVSLIRCTPEKKPAAAYKAHYTLQEQHYIQVFKLHGSPEPEVMACAVTNTKKPKLMAAMAIIESNGNTKAVGDSGQSKGAYQVQAKHWGEVPATATEQAQQAERILEELVQSSRGRLRSGLTKYNGKGRKARQYADRVLRLSRRV
jgi:hypothetical protein